MAPLPRDREKLNRMEQAVRVLIRGIGEDLEREGLRDTPKRVAKALLDCTQGYQQDTSSTLGSALFHEPIVHKGGEGVVVVRDINFASTSEETLLPFHGCCHVAYRPKDGVVLGLSKLARLTKQYARRLQTQERLATEIALALQQCLECHGVAVVLHARHLSNSACPGHRTNACVSGVFATKGSAELEELLSLLDLEDLPAESILSLDRSLSCGLPHVCSTATACGGRCTDPGIQAPGTPDPSEKDTDGDSNDLSLASSCCCDEMEAAMQQLLVEVGENPHRPGLIGSARRYVASLLASTSGYLAAQQGITLAGLFGQQTCGQNTAEGAEPFRAKVGGGGSRGTDCCTGERWPLVDERPEAAECRCAPGPSSSRQGQGQGQGQGQHGGFGEEGDGLLRSALATSSSMVSGVSFHDDSGEDAPHTKEGCCATDACNARLTTGGRSLAAAGPSSLTAGAGARVMVVSSSGPLQGAVTLLLPFTSQCEHHMLPFYGTLMVSYFPYTAFGRTLGLPQPVVEQVVAMYTQRLQVQERITHQVADAVKELLLGLQGAASMPAPDSVAAARVRGGFAERGTVSAPFRKVAAGWPPVGKEAAAGPEAGPTPGGVMVVCDAAHMCMVARGVENHSGSTTTLAVRGVFGDRPELRRAVLRLFRAH